MLEIHLPGTGPGLGPGLRQSSILGDGLLRGESYNCVFLYHTAWDVLARRQFVLRG